MKTLRRALTTSIVTAALLLSTAGLAQADDPDAPATEVAETIAAVAPDAGEVLTAAAADNAFSAQAGETTVVVPEDATTPVAITSTNPDVPDLNITLPGLSGTDAARQADDGTLVYTTDDDASLAVQPLADGSTRLLSVLESQSAPERYDYTFEGRELDLQEDGSVVVLDDGAPVGHIAAPWATGADGTDVPTRYEVDGSTLTQVVEHTDGNYTYPITADPTVSLGLLSIYLHFNRAETSTIADSSFTATGVSAFCTTWAVKLARGVYGTAAAAIFSAACLANAYILVYQAKKAQNSNPKRCLYIRYSGVFSVPVPLTAITYGTYRDARCK